ncbi:hypothetical protein ACHAWF_015280 [Thalassiosira exigua]
MSSPDEVEVEAQPVVDVDEDKGDESTDEESCAEPFEESCAEPFYDKNTWDEGGRSDCGYSDSVHDVLMSVGEAMHSWFGDPSDSMQAHMKGIGSYFQEASYAARDMKCGHFNMIKETKDAGNAMIWGDQEENVDGGNEGNDTEEETSSDVENDEGLAQIDESQIE